MGNTVRIFCAAMILACFIAPVQGSLGAQQDPFKRARKSSEKGVLSAEESPEATENSRSEWRNKLQRYVSIPPWFRQWQRNIQDQVSATALKIKQSSWSESWYLYALGLILAIAFGFLHIAGPGHGKIFTISYLMSFQATLREGLYLSALINIVDSLSAGLIVFLTYGVLSLTFGQGQTVEIIVSMLSYGIIIVWSVWHLFSQLFSRHSNGHQHHGHHCQVNTGKTKATRLCFALGIGLIPCPISTALLIFGLLNQMLGVAIFLVVGVSIGGIIAMTLLSFAVISGKKGVGVLLTPLLGNGGAKPSKLAGILSEGLEIFALLLIIFIASLFLLLSYPIY